MHRFNCFITNETNIKYQIILNILVNHFAVMRLKLSAQVHTLNWIPIVIGLIKLRGNNKIYTDIILYT